MDLFRNISFLVTQPLDINSMFPLEEPVVVETVKSNPVASTNDDDLGVLSMVKDFILKLKKKPDFIFELLLPTLVDYGLISKDSVQMLKMYGAGFVKSESFGLMLDTFANSLGK